MLILEILANIIICEVDLEVLVWKESGEITSVDRWYFDNAE
jgi:hypothetical protein